MKTTVPGWYTSRPPRVDLPDGAYRRRPLLRCRGGGRRGEAWGGVFGGWSRLSLETLPWRHARPRQAPRVVGPCLDEANRQGRAPARPAGG